MQDGTYPPRNFATFGPLWLQPPFAGDSILSITLILLTFQRRAGVRPYTSFYNFAESCVFSKQSLLPIMCHQILALLIPKLQSYFAEFLQHCYLNCFSIFLLVYLCRFKYGLNISWIFWFNIILAF